MYRFGTGVKSSPDRMHAAGQGPEQSLRRLDVHGGYYLPADFVVWVHHAYTTAVLRIVDLSDEQIEFNIFCRLDPTHQFLRHAQCRANNHRPATIHWLPLLPGRETRGV